MDTQTLNKIDPVTQNLMYILDSAERDLSGVDQQNVYPTDFDEQILAIIDSVPLE